MIKRYLKNILFISCLVLSTQEAGAGTGAFDPSNFFRDVNLPLPPFILCLESVKGLASDKLSHETPIKPLGPTTPNENLSSPSVPAAKTNSHIRPYPHIDGISTIWNPRLIS